MKALLTAFLLAAVSVCAVAQSNPPAKRSTPAQAQRNVRDITCPLKAKGCPSFRQLWKAGDEQVRNAAWACFPMNQESTWVSGSATKTTVTLTTVDEFFLLSFSGDNELMRYAYFTDGVTQNDDWGARDKQYKPADKPSDSKRWYREVSGEENPKPFEAFADSQELTLTREFRNANEKLSLVSFSMRFSTGRFAEEWKEDGAGKYTVHGQCINLARARK